MLDGTRSVFHAESVDAELTARCVAGDVHPTGPLWGRGESRVTGHVRTLEEKLAHEYEAFANGLESAGLESARSSLRLPVHDLSWEAMDERTLKLEYSLPAGAYATTVVRELLDTRDVNQGDSDADED